MMNGAQLKALMNRPRPERYASAAEQGWCCIAITSFDGSPSSENPTEKITQSLRLLTCVELPLLETLVTRWSMNVLLNLFFFLPFCPSIGTTTQLAHSFDCCYEGRLVRPSEKQHVIVFHPPIHPSIHSFIHSFIHPSVGRLVGPSVRPSWFFIFLLSVFSRKTRKFTQECSLSLLPSLQPVSH